MVMRGMLVTVMVVLMIMVMEGGRLIILEQLITLQTVLLLKTPKLWSSVLCLTIISLIITDNDIDH